MSLHLYPIEPDDWANGPQDPDGKDCPDCEGSGEVLGEDIKGHVCPRCRGMGLVAKENSDYDWQYDPDMF